jgi:hypothetical protein
MKKRETNMKPTWNLTTMNFISYHSISTFTNTIFFMLLVLAISSTGLIAQSRSNSATQTVTLEVKSVTKISVAGNPTPLIINDAQPGSIPASVNDENTKYSLVTNLDNMKIVASINDQMPKGTKLLVKLNSKATSVGTVDLSSALTPVDVVRGIGKGSDLDQSISYTFAANAEVDDIPAQSRVITLTLTN